jgi:hypothetical protein
MIQLRMPVFSLDSDSWRNQHWVTIVPTISSLHPRDGLAFHLDHGSGREPRAAIAACNCLKFSGLYSSVELFADFGVRGFAHASRQSRFQNCAPILYGGPLENMIPRPGHRLLRL